MRESTLISEQARALSEEFEHAWATVYLPEAKLRVQVAKFYSDSYSDFEIMFWHDEGVEPGKTTMPVPSYLLKIWEEHGRAEPKVMDFYSEQAKRLGWLTLRHNDDGDCSTFVISPTSGDIERESAKLDGLAATVGVAPADLFWAGLLALMRLDWWQRRSLELRPKTKLVRFQLAGDDQAVIYETEVRSSENDSLSQGAN